MMCSAYFGELIEERKRCLNSADKNPYHVLQNKICLECKEHILLDVGAKYFREEIQLDWGSFAWKCTPDELYQFLNDKKSVLPWLIKRDEEFLENIKTYITDRKDTEFGIIFIEEC